MTKRVYWNTESFKDKVDELTKGEYELLGEYTKTHDKITFKHLKCNREFEMTPHNFLVGQRCPYCKYQSVKYGGKKTFDQVAKEVTQLSKGEYKVLPPYKNSKTKMEFIHLACGNHFKMKFNNFQQGQRCPICSSKYRSKLRTMTNADFVKRVESTWGNEYTLLSEYVNSDTPIKVKHNKCGNIYMTRPADFIRGHGCLKCSYVKRSPKIGVNQRTPLSDVKKSIKDILGDQYVVLTKDSDYKGNRQHIKIKHLVCNTVYEAKYSDIQSHHTGCPHCNQSKGERLIFNTLAYHFNFSETKDFYYGYILPNRLHLDFYLPHYRLGIEYDGIQHFKPINYFGGIDSYLDIIKRDKNKDTYCKDNHITLIRIPYTVTTNKEIVDILTEYLSGPRQ